LAPILPASCEAITPVRGDFEAGGYVRASEVQCGAAGLAGATLAVGGLDASGTDALVRIRFADGHSVRALLRPDAPSLVVPARESLLGLFVAHVRMGARHLAGGLDHLLFVAGLVALLGGGRRLLVAVTAFTAGHSVTLVLATLGFVRAPAVLVEVAIAMTLVWLAVELTRRVDGAASRLGVVRRPLALPFAFGLLHGLGFASALGALGVPSREIPLALGGFNVGIEVGQLALVAALLALATLARQCAGFSNARSLRWPALARAYAIGSLGIYWCLDRVAGAF
jgi:HupE / UreJ protein